MPRGVISFAFVRAFARAPPCPLRVGGVPTIIHIVLPMYRPDSTILYHVRAIPVFRPIPRLHPGFPARALARVESRDAPGLRAA